MNLGRASLRVGRIFEAMDPEDRPKLVRSLEAIYGRPMTGAERAARHKANGNGNAASNEISNASEGPSPTPPDVSVSLLSLSDMNDSGTTGATIGPKEKRAAAKREAKRLHRETALRILDFLNEKTGKSFRGVDTNLAFIEARLASGATEANCRGVIARKCADWQGTAMEDKLRPETLFNATKFESYLGERRVTTEAPANAMP